MLRTTLTGLFRRFRKRLGTRRAVIVLLALGALELAGVAVAIKAWADSVRTSSCVGAYGSATCTTHWRWSDGDPNVTRTSVPRSAQEEREALERDRKWIARCRPVIRQDEFGVSRYYYAARGCEFGKTED